MQSDTNAKQLADMAAVIAKEKAKRRAKQRAPGEAVPVAETEKVASLPWVMTRLTGWRVIKGGSSTVKEAVSLVATSTALVMRTE